MDIDQLKYNALNLTEDNLPLVFEVTKELDNLLQLSDDYKLIYLPLDRPSKVLSELISTDEVNNRDSYSELREKALEYLKSISVIDGYDQVTRGKRQFAGIQLACKETPGEVIFALTIFFNALRDREKNQRAIPSIRKVEFDDSRGIIKIGQLEIMLPPYKNEYYFCLVMFEHKVKEPVSWDIIYDRMTGNSVNGGGIKPDPIRKNWQKVNDAMKRVNNRIRSKFNNNDKLFSWGEKTVIRNY
jgi:hypothetical protein